MFDAATTRPRESLGTPQQVLYADAARTLPLFVAPVAGEAFDSWLEAIAARHHAPFGEIVRRCGIPPKALRDTAFIGHDADSYRLIAEVTGLDAAAVRTIAQDPQYRPTAGLDYRRLQGNSSGWERRKTSRFCPQCLASNGGRWLSHWHLNWSYACIEHQCLLADVCPKCQGPQRQRPHPLRHVPVPGHCAQIRTTAARGSSSLCTADLSALDMENLRDLPMVISTQGHILDLLAGRLVASPVYKAPSPTCPRQILNDMKILARWMVSILQRGIDCCYVPDALIRLVGSPECGPRLQSRFQPSALEAAVGITAAAELLASHNDETLEGGFRRIIDADPAGASLVILGRQGLTYSVRSAYDRALARVRR